MSSELTFETLANRGESVLLHFGVKGMRWGVRKRSPKSKAPLSPAEKVELGLGALESGLFLKRVAEINASGRSSPFDHLSLAEAGLIESASLMADVAIARRWSKRRPSSTSKT